MLSVAFFRTPYTLLTTRDSQTDIIAVERVFYNTTRNFSYQWLLVMSTQLVSLLSNVKL